MRFQNNFATFFCRLGRGSRRLCIATCNNAPVVTQSSLQNSNAPIQMHPSFISTSRKVLDSNSDTISRGSTSSPPLTFGTVEEDTLPDHHWSPTTAAMWKQRIGRNFSGPAQQVLLTKHPDDSRTEVVYDYATNAGLREKYRNPWGYVRLGRILEDLDSLAGTVAAKHCADVDMNTRPLVLFTASVDGMNVRKALRLDADLALIGTVTWVGRSSLEISIRVLQSEPDSASVSDSITARFTFVARDAATNGGAPVNKLVVESDEEKRLFAQGAARDRLRKAARRSSDGSSGDVSADVSRAKAGPQLEEEEEGGIRAGMQGLGGGDSTGVVGSCMEYALMCQPQHRNTHGRVFGGFLIRRAYELAFATAYVFCGIRPTLLEVDHVEFRRPVDIGDVLRLKSRVVQVEPGGAAGWSANRMGVKVSAILALPELNTAEVSTIFHFTFLNDQSQNGSENS